MSDNLIEITCPRCGHVWHEDVTKLEKVERQIMKNLTVEAALQPPVTSYRACCPKDGTYVVVDVAEARHG